MNLPPGLSINSSTGVISGTVAYADAEAFGGSYSPTVIVIDGHGGSNSESLAWTITDTNRAPTLTTPANQSGVRNDTVSLAVSASDPDSDQLLYDATGLPPGLSIDSLTGTISGQIDASAVVGTAYDVTVTATDQTDTATASFTWDVGLANHAPTLDAVPDQGNAAGDPVSLPLTAADADSDPLTYTATGLPDGLSIDPTTGDITGTLAAAAASATPYSVSVRVSDGMASASRSFPWTVDPVGVTGPGDQAGVNGDTVSVPVTGSNSAGLPLTYSATGLPPGLSIDSGTGTIAGTLGGTAAAGSPYSVTVTASDGTHSGSQSFAWTVAHLALAAPDNRSDRDAATVSLQLAGTDADSDTLTYSATGLPAGLSLNAGTGLISGTVGTAAHVHSPYAVTVTTSDGTHSASQSFVWSVTPRVGVVNPGPAGSATGDTVSLQVQATALAGGTLSYSATGLPAGLSISSTTGEISGTIDAGAAQAAPYAVAVTASDGTSSSSQTFAWTVAPVAVSSPGGQTNLTTDSVSLAVTASYHGMGTLTYLADGLPSGLSIDSSTGVISGTVGSLADANSPYTVTVTASAGMMGTGSASQTFAWTVKPRVQVEAPGNQAVAAGDTILLPVSGTDALAGTLAWSVTGLPSGLSIDSATGTISGTVALGAEFSSPYSVTVTASDGTASGSTTIPWTVAHLGLADSGPQTGADGTTVSLTLHGTDADSDTLTYSATGLPSGLGIDSATGVISGTLGSSADAGSPYLATVTVSDGTDSVSRQILWTVTQVGVANPGGQTSLEGDTISLQVLAPAPPGAGALVYSAAGLPAGLVIDPITGNISGVLAPGVADNGPYSVTIAADDGTISTSQTFTWDLTPQITLVAPGDQANVEGDSVTVAFTATAASGLTLTYGAANLPDGLSINTSTGTISGTVAAGDAAAGPYGVTATAGDGTYSSSKTFTWTVTHGSNSAPALTSPGAQANVPGDVVNLALTATDADSDTLTYSATGLPGGLVIDPSTGLISGTLGGTATLNGGPYTVTVVVDDGNGGTDSQTFDWIVNDTTLTLASATASAVEGVPANGVVVATFTDPNLSHQAGDYTATIDWGDGNTSGGFVDGSSGNFTVIGAYAYADPGTYSVVVTVTDAAGSITAVTSTVTVAAAPITITGGLTLSVAWAGGRRGRGGRAAGVRGGLTLSVAWAGGLPGNLAVFQDANQAESALSYTATVDWGDGSSSTYAVVMGQDGAFSVSGDGGHSYPVVGSYTVTITVTDADGTTVSATDTVVVGDLAAGRPTDLTVISFSTDQPGAVAGDFTATIDWGDGNTGTGVVSGGSGTFDVTGSYVYPTDGSYTVTVTVEDGSGGSINTSTSVIVVPAPVVAYGANISATQGETVTDVTAAVFVDANPYDTATEYGTTVDVGDGAGTETGTVTGSAGLFNFLINHTFSDAGIFHPLITGLWDQTVPEFVLLSTAFVAQADGTEEVTFAEGGHIRHPDTPAKMIPDRIPPGGNYLLKLDFANGLANQYPLTIKIMGASQANGSANVSRPGAAGGGLPTPSLPLTDPKERKVSLLVVGNRSTEATDTAQAPNGGKGGGNAGNLFLGVYNKNGKLLSRTFGFSVAAIPINVTGTFLRTVKGELKIAPGAIGMLVNISWASDSGVLGDLDRVYMSEQVQGIRVTGKFKNLRNVVGTYSKTPATVFSPDLNAIDIRPIVDAAKTGTPSSSEVSQVFIFRDYRTGAKDIPITKSGFKITYDVLKNPVTKFWDYVVKRQSANVTANGFTAQAGQMLRTDPFTATFTNILNEK